MLKLPNTIIFYVSERKNKKSEMLMLDAEMLENLLDNSVLLLSQIYSKPKNLNCVNKKELFNRKPISEAMNPMLNNSTNN